MIVCFSDVRDLDVLMIHDLPTPYFHRYADELALAATARSVGRKIVVYSARKSGDSPPAEPIVTHSPEALGEKATAPASEQGGNTEGDITMLHWLGSHADCASNHYMLLVTETDPL